MELAIRPLGLIVDGVPRVQQSSCENLPEVDPCAANDGIPAQVLIPDDCRELVVPVLQPQREGGVEGRVDPAIFVCFGAEGLGPVLQDNVGVLLREDLCVLEPLRSDQRHFQNCASNAGHLDGSLGGASCAERAQ